MLANLLKTSFFILSLVLSTSLLGSSSVNAQSVYDNVIQVQEPPVKIEYIVNQYNFSYEFTNNWYALFTTHDIPQSYANDGLTVHGVNCSFNPSTAENWALSVRSEWGETKDIRLIWNNTDTALIFQNDTLIPQGNYSSCTATLNSNNEIHISNFGDMVAHSDEYIGSHTTLKPYFINWDIDYPPNYQGQIPPDTIEIPEEPNKIGVSIRGSVVEDIVQIEWYNDPDNPKPDNAQGMYLVLHNSNFDEIPPECSNQNAQEWRHNLNEIAVFNKVPCYGMWYVQSYYTSDPEGQNIIPNTDKTVLNLRIDGGSFYFDYVDVEYDEDGSIISPPITGVNMAECVHFIQSMPFVEFDYQGCFSNMTKFIGIASTNRNNVSKQFNDLTIPAHQGCGSFTKINDYIHLTSVNNYVCPQLTDGLRQPITLFAVFLLYVGAMFGWFKLMSGRR